MIKQMLQITTYCYYRLLYMIVKHFYYATASFVFIFHFYGFFIDLDS